MNEYFTPPRAGGNIDGFSSKVRRRGEKGTTQKEDEEREKESWEEEIYTQSSTPPFSPVVRGGNLALFEDPPWPT